MPTLGASQRAVAAFLDKGGGTLQLTGTPEAGRVTVINTAGMAVADVGWMSMTDEELAAAGRSAACTTALPAH
jgi:hypothetical protein